MLTMHRVFVRAAVLGAVGLLLASCGGGGGGDSGGATTPPPITPEPPSGTAPQVASPPTSRAVAANATVRFGVAVAGTGPFSYQWRRDGTAIGGATGATYTLAGVSLNDDGARISVTVSNSAGSTTSDEARLTVNPQPVAGTACSSGATFDVVAEPSVSTQMAGGAVVLGCSGPLSDVTWTPTSGNANRLLASRSQAISMEPRSIDPLSYELRFKDVNGVQHSQNINISANPIDPNLSHLVVKSDHAVRQGQTTSVRAWPIFLAGTNVTRITWAQLEGPAVELDVADDSRAIFTAPAVSRDTLLRFKATMLTSSGRTASDEVLVLVEKTPAAPVGQLFDEPVASRVYPYRTMSPHAANLVRCVQDPALFFVSSNNNNLCTLGTLPLLAQQTFGAEPSIAQIMDRVLVSHDWMGASFQRFLEAQASNPDFQRLLGSVTAIVIGAHVRPSFYWAATGAIYLDADSLWLTAEERDTISEVPDSRAGNGDELNYTGLWRYVTSYNQTALRYYDPATRDGRAFTDLNYELGSLLYHELAHANDYFPSSSRALVDSSLRVYQASPNQLPSDRLAALYPLQSSEMFGLARVTSFGETASAAQKAYTPRQVADFFRVDRATDEYSYSVAPGSNVGTPREDLAMLFEEFMMNYRQQVRRDVAFADRYDPAQGSGRLLVRWGQRGRVGEAPIKPRLTQVLGDIAPWISTSAVNTLPAPVPLREGQSWATNLDPTGTGAGTAKALAARDQTAGSKAGVDADLRRMQERQRQRITSAKKAAQFENQISRAAAR
jgi:hypothetical protein